MTTKESAGDVKAIKIHALEIVLVALENIKLNPKNRNKHPPEQLNQLELIMRVSGFRRPVTISNRSGLLVCGEGRYLVAKRAGMYHIPAIFQDYESEAEEYADGIADNAIEKQSILDYAGINVDIIDFGPDLDIAILGLKDFELEPADKPQKEKKKITCPRCSETF